LSKECKLRGLGSEGRAEKKIPLLLLDSCCFLYTPSLGSCAHKKKRAYFFSPNESTFSAGRNFFRPIKRGFFKHDVSLRFLDRGAVSRRIRAVGGDMMSREDR
jgi:hypothetical protein